MLDYKSIIIKRYALNMSYKELAIEFGASKSGINDFIRAFEKSGKVSYPLPEGITNYAIYELVYGHEPGTNNRSSGYEQPDFAKVHQQMEERKNMTLVYQSSGNRKRVLTVVKQRRHKLSALPFPSILDKFFPLS